MKRRLYVGPKRQLAVEILTVAIPTITAVWISSVSGLQAVVLVVFVLALAGILKYVTVYSPQISYREKQLTAFLDKYLQLVIADYESRHDTTYDVRANVMRPERRIELSYTSTGLSVNTHNYLKIAYYAGGGEGSTIDAHDTGTRDETETEWRIGDRPEGNCGRAFELRQVSVVTRDQSTETWSSQRTTDDQDKATRQVNAVLSVPITRPNSDRPVAILNIDAPVPADQTNFGDEAVQTEVAERYADAIGILL